MAALRISFVVAVALIVGFPGSPEHATLHYSLTFAGSSAKGTIVGTWGGTAVQGAYSNGQWAIGSSGTLVVGGTYHCRTGCTFEGIVTYLGKPTRVSLVAKTLGDAERSETVEGELSIDLPRL